MCVTCGASACVAFVSRREERGHLEDTGVDGRLIKIYFKPEGLESVGWIMWISAGTASGSCGLGGEHSSFIKCRENL